VKENAERLDRLVTDLLDLARIESGRVELRRVSFPVRKVAEQLLENMEPAAAAKGVALSAMVPDLQAWADRDKLHQILTNLVGNALKFTPPGGKVTVRARRAAPEVGGAPGVVEIAVEDTGEGVPPDEREAIFDKFYQVRRSHTAAPPGAGLGLAITKSLVELHGGTIWVESEVARGSRFCFTLPAGPAPDA
jgi:signal transduction histidine kinase